MPLKKLRQQIDKLDEKILEILNLRAKKVKELSKIKKEKKINVFQESRHKQILYRLFKKNKGPLKNEHIENIYREIFSACLDIQKKLKIAYLGPEGTFTHQAALKKFGRNLEFISCSNIQEVFNMVASQNVDLGVVPIENSIEGVITHTLDMFIDSDIKICSEIILRISLCLLSKEKDIEKIKKIYSHPQVFVQAKVFLQEKLPDATLLSCDSTSLAAKLATKEKNSACIGSEALASIYNLNVLEKNIQDYAHNVTRFLVISLEDSQPTGNDKTSILFSLKDRVGALHDALAPFKRYQINLTKIESRPSRKRAWEYFFFVDFEGHRTQRKIKLALKELEKECLFLKILGSYPKEIEKYV